MTTDNINYRYERKFLITDISFRKIEKIIQLNSANFRKLYSERTINNIYFDNDILESFHDNVDGIAKREKIRIRWYGDRYGVIANPILEIKKRNNSVGTKDQYVLKEFTINENLNEKFLKELITKSEIPSIIKNKVLALQPKLLNSYRRKYFISFDKKFRITLDHHLYYMKFMPLRNRFLFSVIDNKSTILEIKYDMKNDEKISAITNEFNFRLTKNSKYVTGMFSLYV